LFVASCKTLGLNMTVGVNPVDNCGTEFLKGMFVYVNDRLVRQELEQRDFLWRFVSHVWTPVPGRLFKLGKYITRRNPERLVEAMPALLQANARSINSFILPPILSVWAKIWEEASVEHSAQSKTMISLEKSRRWVNIESDTSPNNRVIVAPISQSSGWRCCCLAAIENRYGLSRADVGDMEDVLYKVGTQAYHFQNELWRRLVDRDYS
jgi:hypothetical protein